MFRNLLAAASNLLNLRVSHNCEDSASEKRAWQLEWGTLHREA